MKPVIVVMGVSGCGKSTIGKMLAKTLKIPFFDGDDFHPESNIIKMKNQVPLTDIDREPWLTKLSELLLEQSNKNGAVLACSALKKSYRKILSRHIQPQYIHLSISKEQVLIRLKTRKNHFMPTGLIDSQFSTLEYPEDAIQIDASMNLTEIIQQIKAQI